MDEDRGVILIVDDIPTNLEVLMEFLESSGYRVRVATEGESALEQIEYAPPDIILLDVMMPGMDGFETCQRLKENPVTRDIPVIFMTALSDTVDKVRGFELGAADYVTKPLHKEEVVARVNAHLVLHRQKQEIERLRQQDRLYYEKLSQIKDDILSTASHDLKNPLAGIMATVYLLGQHLPQEDKKGRQYLENLQYDANRMYDLITNLLDLARLETGMALERQPVSLRKLLEKNISDVAPAARRKNIRLKVDDLPDETVTVNCDADRFSQVLQNLLSNAIKYTPEGGEVEVNAEVGRGEVWVKVADTGIGIPEEDLPRLFDKFYRVNTRQHMAVPGTGLGLSIVKEIIEQHGGRIWVDSELEVGSTFAVALPYP
jgi:signal transduction histidine kinase